ncbi:kinase-like domain-containing protein [Xylariaceae sp. FL1272]|nr:kinase-like domain-containing protein [Xylariaceae sp. FL1272]
MWWDASQIESTVTRQFVCSHLIPTEIERLDRPLGFGDGLTDGTYWEWIDEKAKRIFLILLDLGIPDQIFGIIDDSWDDTDLPIALDEVERLGLTANKDPRTVKKFYARQYHYLVRYIEKGDHVVYQDDEVVPAILADKRPGLTAGSNATDRVELPNNPDQIFSRRRIPIGDGPGMVPDEVLMIEINSTRNLQHEHVASYYASYTHQGAAYVIFSHTSELTVKSLLSTTPGPLKSLAKQDRRRMVMNWVHCLADTLCYIHRRGRSHGNIKPSTILLSANHHIFYASTSRLGAEASVAASEKSTFDRESYDYAAPEQWYRPSSMHRRATPTSSSWFTNSPDSNTFHINRGATEHTPSSAMHTPTPHLDPQAADIFSLGCVMLELLGLQLKRTSRSFASHRAAKHKSAGRGGAVLDSSFHKNLGQVESWMAGLAKDASKKDDAVFLGFAPLLHVVARMLSVLPHERPSALEVEQAMYKILREKCGISEPHCVHQYDAGFEFGFAGLSIDEKDDNFSIATKRHSNSPGSPRPGSRLSVHRRSFQDRDSQFTSSSGSAASLRTPRQRAPWQESLFHGGYSNYVMGTN